MGLDFLGPFFTWQLTRSTRRRRNYLFRSLYAAALLAVMIAAFWTVVFEQLRMSPTGVRALSPYADFADTYFHCFSLIQLTAVLLLTPSLVAPVFASEKLTGRAELLLTTNLTGWEMVVGPTVARMITVAVFVAVGLPVLSISTFCGGVDPAQLLLLTVLTAATVVATAGMAAVFSVHSSTSRRALTRSYVLLAILLCLPLLCGIARAKTSPTNPFAARLAHWELLSAQYNPYLLYRDSVLAGWSGETSSNVRKFAWGCLGLCGVCLLWGALRARAECRKSIGRMTKKQVDSPLRRLRRLWVRQIGSDPMLWKEWHFERRSGKSLALGVFQLTAATAICIFMLYLVPFTNWTQQGLWSATTLNEYLRFTLPTLVMGALLAVAVRAASSFESERKYNCMTLLLLTDMEPGQIIRAKCLASLKPIFHLLIGGLPVFILSVDLGGLTALSAVLFVATTVLYGVFIATVGVFCSIRWSSPTTASTATIAYYLGFVCGIQYLLLVWFTPLVAMMARLAGLPMTRVPELMSLGLPWVLLAALTTDFQNWTAGTVIAYSICALAPAALFLMLARVLYRQMLANFFTYSGQTDSGDLRELSTGEIRGLAAGPYPTNGQLSHNPVSELLTHS